MQAPNGSPVLLDDPSSPLPPPRDRRRPPVLGFRAPEPEELTEDLSSSPSPSSPSSSPLDEDGPGSGSAGSPSVDPLDQLDGDLTSSSDSSTDGKPLRPLGRAALKATTMQAILVGSAMAHRVAARTEGQRVVGLYIADEDDAEKIGTPLANFAHRHGGIAGGKVSEDANDLIQAGLGLANYATKQVLRAQQAREVDQHLAAGGSLPTPEEEA